MTRKSILLISVIIGIIAIFSFINSPFFHVRKFSISGNKYILKNKIFNYVKSYEGHNILFLEKEKIKKRLKEQENYIKEVNISKEYPDKLNISIKERKPLAKIINNGVYIVFDKDGIILEDSKDHIKADVPLIKGIGYYFQAEKVDFTEPLEKIIDQLKKLDNSLIKDIDLIKYKNSTNQQSNIIVKILDNVEVYIGDLNKLADKFEILAATLEKIKKEEISVDYVNLKYPEKPVYKLE